MLCTRLVIFHCGRGFICIEMQNIELLLLLVYIQNRNYFRIHICMYFNKAGVNTELLIMYLLALMVN